MASNMTDDDKALVETVRLEAEINKNYDSIAYRLLTRIADRIEALSAEKEAIRMEERAAIVAWLRSKRPIFRPVADAIEAGEHRDD